jgi:hypothetical protein
VDGSTHRRSEHEWVEIRPRAELKRDTNAVWDECAIERGVVLNDRGVGGVQLAVILGEIIGDRPMVPIDVLVAERNFGVDSSHLPWVSPWTHR